MSLAVFIAGSASAKTYQRIISLYPAHTENLFALGLNKEIIGVGPSANFPPQVKNIPRFSYRGDAERIIAAHPDLVLIRPVIARGYPGLVEELKKLRIKVVSLQPRSIKEMYAYWRRLGELTGRQRQAAAMVARFQKAVAAYDKSARVIPAAKKKKVYFEAIHRRMRTFAHGSMALFCLKTAGGINVASDAKSVRNSNIAAYGKERLLAHAAGIDIFLSQEGRMNRITREIIMNEPGFSVIKAVRQKQVYLVPEALVSRPTMRLLEGIALIRKILYGNQGK